MRAITTRATASLPHHEPVHPHVREVVVMDTVAVVAPAGIGAAAPVPAGVVETTVLRVVPILAIAKRKRGIIATMLTIAIGSIKAQIITQFPLYLVQAFCHPC